MTLSFSRRALRRNLTVILAIVIGAGLLAEIANAVLGLDGPPLVVFFSLSYEKNLPTWISSCQLFMCGLLLLVCALASRREGSKFERHWWGLALIFFYISLDEFVEIHEYAGGFADLEGIFYFSWVIPAAIVVAAVGFIYLPFLKHLPGRTRRRFALAGAIFITGALLLELPLGYWTDQSGSDNLTYGLIDWVQELLELSSIGFFLVSLVDYLAGPSEIVTMRFGE